VFPLGSWKNLIEMEDELTLEELGLLQEQLYKSEHRRNKFAAALKGVDLPDMDDGQQSSFDEIKARVEEELSGKRSAKSTYSAIGISYEAD
jgi:hypothetical protein